MMIYLGMETGLSEQGYGIRYASKGKMVQGKENGVLGVDVASWSLFWTEVLWYGVAN